VPQRYYNGPRKAAAKLAGAFDSDGGSSNNEQQEELTEKLYAQIGQLKVEKDWLKKITIIKSLSPEEL
jgi:transposase